MEYSCKCCERDFGENRIKYEFHLTTSGHNKKQNLAKSEMSPTDYLMDMVATLKKQVQDLSGGGGGAAIIKRPSKKPLSFTKIITDKIYTIEQVVDRKNTDMLLPEKSWTKFIYSAFTNQTRQKYISHPYKPLETAANLLLTKFYETPQELLPIVVLNNDKGKNKKIAYYYSDGTFQVKTNIKKRRNVELYARIDFYLFKAFAQTWLEPKLKEIYRSLPIEIKNKVHYHTTDGNQISFLDFKCTCTDNAHSKCYRDMLVEDEDYKVWRYKDRELKNIDGNDFRLVGDDYFDFVQDFVDHIENHDLGYAYNEYRENRDIVSFDKDSEDSRYTVVDDVYDLITKRCLFKKCDEDA